MSDVKEARKRLIERIVEGDGRASREQRRAAFDDEVHTKPMSTLIHKVATHAHKVTEEDIAEALGSGLTEDQLFEVIVCAAVGQANRQYDAALAALDAACGKE